MRSVLLALPLVGALVLGCAQETRQDISIGTGGTGGVYYPYGGGLAEIWSQNLPGLRVVAEVTGASVENVKLAHRGETVIGEIMGDVAYQAYNGLGKFEDDPQDILGLAVMYPSVLHIVTLEGSEVRGMGDLSGRRVSIGAPGSGTAYMGGLVLESLGISQETFGVRRLSFVENTNALKDHSIEVGFWVVAPPASSIMDLATTHGVRIIPFTPEEQLAITRQHGFYSALDLAGGVYRGVEEPVPTISVWNVIICKADLPEDLVYDLVRVLYEQNDYMQRIHPFARYTTARNAAEHSPIPLHPGSVRCLREMGLTVADRLIHRGGGDGPQTQE